MAKMTLSIKQKKFIDEYISNGGNGVQAALFAYNTSDYKTADAISRENLEKPRIKAYFQAKFAAKGLNKDDVTDILIKHINSGNPLVSLRACEVYYRYFYTGKKGSGAITNNEDDLEKVRVMLSSE